MLVATKPKAPPSVASSHLDLTTKPSSDGGSVDRAPSLLSYFLAGLLSLLSAGFSKARLKFLEISSPILLNIFQLESLRSLVVAKSVPGSLPKALMARNSARRCA